MTDRFRDRLSEYIDGNLEPRERKLVERHVETCPECSRTIEELRAVVARAGELGEREPPRDLWKTIERRIGSHAAEGRSREENGADSRGRARREVGAARRISFSIPQLAAAAIVVATLSAATAWMTVGAGAGGEAAGLPEGADAPPATLAAAGGADAGASLETPEQYAAAIAELERVLFAGETPLPPDIEATVRRALVTIDRAIEDARTALARLPDDPYLTRHVASTLRRKAEFLRDAVRLARG